MQGRGNILTNLFVNITVTTYSANLMSLSPEITYEYYFRNAFIYYCKEHGCLRVTDDHEDSVLLNGITEEDINTFITYYNLNVKDKKEDNAEE